MEISERSIKSTLLIELTTPGVPMTVPRYDAEHSTLQKVHPALRVIILLTNMMDRLFRWVFDFSGISIYFAGFVCLFGGLIFYGVANSLTAINDPDSVAAIIRSYWVALYGQSETVGVDGGRMWTLIATGMLLFLPVWIVIRLIQLALLFVFNFVRRAFQQTSV